MTIANITLTASQIAAAFNEWMRRYTENPDAFCREFESVVTFLGEVQVGKTPSYGDEQAAYFIKLIEELKGD